MAKNTNYFPHDHNARHDRKLVKLRLDLGMTGIGIYWSIVEMLYEENGEIKLADLPIIAKELKEKLQKIQKVLENYELFENNGEVFWSNSVIDRIKKINSKSSKAAESATKRWAKDANALRSELGSHCEGNASKVNKSKVKESKENKSKGVDEVFERWWDLYDKKQGKEKCLKKWGALEPDEIIKILEHTISYVQSTPEKQFRKNPETYLNGKHWNDEIIFKTITNAQTQFTTTTATGQFRNEAERRTAERQQMAELIRANIRGSQGEQHG